MRQILLSLLLITASFSTQQVHAALLDHILQSKSFPHCDDARVLKRVMKRFNWSEKRTWDNDVRLTEISRVRERRTDDFGSIPRRYCRGHALLSNGRHPTVYFLIEGGQGFAGNSYNVEFCMNGFDRWNEDNGSCRVLR